MCWEQQSTFCWLSTFSLSRLVSHLTRRNSVKPWNQPLLCIHPSIDKNPNSKSVVAAALERRRNQEPDTGHLIITSRCCRTLNINSAEDKDCKPISCVLEAVIKHSKWTELLQTTALVPRTCNLSKVQTPTSSYTVFCQHTAILRGCWCICVHLWLTASKKASTL